MSEAVERKPVQLLHNPTVSPYGNHIPGLDELGDPAEVEGAFRRGLVPLHHVTDEEAGQVVVRRIGEPIQDDTALMARMRRAGVRPGAVVTVQHAAGGVLVGSGGEATELSLDVAAHVFVAAR